MLLDVDYAVSSTSSSTTSKFANFKLFSRSYLEIGFDGSTLVNAMKVVIEEALQPLKMEQHLLKQSLPTQYDQHITPSSFCNSEHTPIFNDILQLCRFGIGNLSSRVVDADQTLPSYDPNGNPLLDFPTVCKWHWKNRKEKDSYKPLQKFLNEQHIHVVDLSSGANLSFGNLFMIQLYSLKKKLNVRSKELLPVERSICRYHLRGRTDFVRVKHPHLGISRFNIQYYIEIKMGSIGETELREAFYQLIGGNAGNSDRSPPVFITSLTSHHYVLFVTLYQGAKEEDYAYQLNIYRFKSFHQAIKYLEDVTADPHCCTRDFLRPPTPSDSPPKSQSDQNELEDDAKIEIEVVDEFAELAVDGEEEKNANESSNYEEKT